jgi:small GTP-binding protein
VSDAKPFKWKVCLIGESSVGKTSLIKRYVYDIFDESYSNTIGAHVTKKELTIQHPRDNREIGAFLMIWDVMGQQCFLHMLRESYFFGAAGIIAVCDVTRKNTMKELAGWIEQALSVSGDVPMVILGNKSDLADQQEIDFPELETFASNYKNTIAFLSSVKTGHNVELTFKTLCEKMLEKTF